VAAGGIISLFQSLPTIVHGAKAGLKSVMGDKTSSGEKDRTADDLPFSFVVVGTIVMVIGLWFAPALHINFFSAIMIILFGFLFVTVSSRLTGEIGSSSNPISGMTVATLLLTCLVFLAVGWIGPEHRVGALSIAAVVCIAASNGGTTSQDLKTGYIVGATPRFQQIGLLVGALTSAVVIGYSLILLNDASTVYTKKVPDYTVTDMSIMTMKQKVAGPEAANDSAEYHVLQVTEQSPPEMLAALAPGKYLVNDAGKVTYLVDPGINGSVNKRDDGTSVTKYEAPKARLMSLIIDGILTQKLPWGLVLLGVALALVLELCGISALPFAVGVYLPISASTPIFVGGIVRWFVERKKTGNETEAEAETGPGVLYSSGLIAGGAIAGILLALTQIMPGLSEKLDFSGAMGSLGGSDLFAIVVFAIAAGVLFYVGRKKSNL
jgi:uncharacterized oligopeptide transporter (OPT) family protein